MTGRNEAAAAVRAETPIVSAEYDASSGPTGLLIVDEVHGFCTVGRGPLAPPVPNSQVIRMIEETDALATKIGPKIVLRDSHPPGQVEAPYPEHCVRGSGDDELVEQLAWLERDANAVVIPKECINGVIGAMRPDGSNAIFDFIREHRLRNLVAVGICTDICVLTAVTTLLSARTRGFLGDLRDIVVYEPGCATYDLPLDAARSLGLPDSAAHPQELYHAMGLAIMQNQGAILAGTIAGLGQ